MAEPRHPDFTGLDVRKRLREPFPKEQIGKLPASAKRPELDFVGHAAVTDRLNAAAPDWTYVVDELFSVEGKVWIRGTMMVGGVSRVEYGDGADPKEAIGNFIRRGAMRFGVALDLWSRQELESAPVRPEADAGGRVDSASSASRTSSGDASNGAASGADTLAATSPDSSEGNTAVLAGTDAADPSEGGEPGEEAPFSPQGNESTSASPGSTAKYPADPLTCDHKFGTGAPAKVRIRGKDICRLCGMDWISAVEGTTADLGSA